ncbi:MAG: hypothetical protein AAF518_27635 [Spirochaetota bacterium]
MQKPNEKKPAIYTIPVSFSLLFLVGVFLAVLGEGVYDILGAILMLPSFLTLIWFSLRPLWQKTNNDNSSEV